MRQKLSLRGIFCIFFLVTITICLFFPSCKKAPIPFLEWSGGCPYVSNQTASIYGKSLTYFNDIVIDGQIYSGEIKSIDDDVITFGAPELDGIQYSEIYLTYEGGRTEAVEIVFVAEPTLDSMANNKVFAGDTLTLSVNNIIPEVTTLSIDGSEVELVNVNSEKISFVVPTELAPDGDDPTSAEIQLFMFGDCIKSDKMVLEILPAKDPAPIIDRLSTLEVSVGDTLAIFGQNLFNGTTPAVTFTPNIPATEFVNTVTESKIEVIVPEKAKSGPISLKTNAEDSTLSEIVILLPKIISLDPKFGRPLQETNISLTGWNFEGFRTVTWNNNAIQNPTEISENLISFTISIQDTMGSIPIQVMTTSGTSNVEYFIVSDTSGCSLAQPTLNQPSADTFSPGDLITLNGTNLERTVAIYIDDVETNLSNAQITEREIQFEAPDLSCGDHTISVETSCGSTSSIQITIERIPTVRNFKVEGTGPQRRLVLEGKWLQSEDIRIVFNDTTFTQPTDEGANISIPISTRRRNGFLQVLSESCGSSNPVYIQLPLLIAELDPQCVSVDQEITLFGNFPYENLQIVINDVITIEEYNQIDSNTISFLVEEGFEFRTFNNVRVVSLNDAGNQSNRVQFEFLDGARVERILPRERRGGGGVIIWGSNFENVVTLKFQNTITDDEVIMERTVDFDFNNPDQQKFVVTTNGQFEELAFYVPSELTAGSYQLSLIAIGNDGCRVESSSDQLFTVNNLPFVRVGSGFVPLILANPPTGIPLPGIGNLWRVIDYSPLAWVDETVQIERSGGITFRDSVFTCSPNEEKFIISESDDRPIGVYRPNGQGVQLTFEGKEYFGRADDFYPRNPHPSEPFLSDEDCSEVSYPFPIRVILTPEESGGQLEMIFPYVIDRVSPEIMTKGNTVNVTINGRYFDENIQFQASGFVGLYGPLDSENERTIDFDLIEVSDVIRNGNGTAINFNLLIDNSIPAGRYGLSLREELQFHHSNEIEVIVE